jgi:hypothetical protein
MTTEKHDPWALLREALPFVETVKSDGVFGADDRASALFARIDAALAEHDTVPSSEVDWQMTNSPIGTMHAHLDGVDLRVRWDGQDAAWDATHYGRCATEAKAKTAAIAAARGMK